MTRKRNDKIFPADYADIRRINQRDFQEKNLYISPPTYASVSTNPKGELICNCHFNLCCF